MMGRWWTYSVSDVLLFSAETYLRLYERYNEALWPWQLLPLIVGLMIPAIIKAKPGRSGRWVAAIFALSWSWVAWGFHLQRYATINWVAPAFAGIFQIEAVFLIWAGTVRDRLVFMPRSSMPNRMGWCVYYFAIIGQPLLFTLSGHAWRQAGLFGSAPDPTAVATLGLILAASKGTHWGLMIIPLIWCVISGATLYGLASPVAVTMFLTLSIVLVCAVAKSLGSQA